MFILTHMVSGRVAACAITFPMLAEPWILYMHSTVYTAIQLLGVQCDQQFCSPGSSSDTMAVPLHGEETSWELVPRAEVVRF